MKKIVFFVFFILITYIISGETLSDKQKPIIITRFPEGKRPMTLAVKNISLPGNYRLYNLILKMKVDKINGLGRSVIIDIKDSAGALLREYSIFAFFFKRPNEFQDISILFPKGKSNSIRVEIKSFSGYYGKAKDIEEAVIKNIVVNPFSTVPYIENIIPDKVRYKKGEKGKAEVIVVNPTLERVRCVIKGEIISELNKVKNIYSKNLTLAPHEEKIIYIPFTTTREEYGRELKVDLFQGNKLISSRSEYFSVANNIWKVYLAGEVGPNFHQPITWTPEREKEWEEKMKKQYMLGTYSYGNHYERFSWAPGEAFDLTPDEKEWWSGQSTYRSSLETMRGFIKHRQKRGVACISYINQAGSGPAAYEIGRKHPEWVEKGKDGVWIGRFDMAEFERWDSIKTLEEVRSTARPGHFYFICFDYSLPVVRDYVISEIIKSTKMFNWDGVRWDCGQMGGIPENIRKMKKDVWKIFPDFVFGYNIESRSYKIHPEEFKECCADGGLIMEEGVYMAYEKNHPLHKWKDYSIHLNKTQKLVHKLGGYYNPFIQRRGGARYLIDGLYENVLQLSAGSHPVRLGIRYGNVKLPGNLPKFITRYSAFLWSDNIWKMENPEKIVKIEGFVWWKEQASVRTINENHKQYIIHLINPPYKEKIEENPEGILRAPVKNIKVVCKIPQKFKVKGAYLLNPISGTEAEKLNFKEEGNKVRFEIDEVKIWKFVVVDLEKE